MIDSGEPLWKVALFVILITGMSAVLGFGAWYKSMKETKPKAPPSQPKAEPPPQPKSTEKDAPPPVHKLVTNKRPAAQFELEGFQSYVETYTPPQGSPFPIYAGIDNVIVPTPLDAAYNEYERVETEAMSQLQSSAKRVQIPDPVLPDFGALFRNFDAEVRDIPWDSDNRMYVMNDVVWGDVSLEASKSIFLKLYHRELLGNPDNVQTVGDEGSPAYLSPIIPVSVSDPYANALAATGAGMLTQKLIEPHTLVPDRFVTRTVEQAMPDGSKILVKKNILTGINTTTVTKQLANGGWEATETITSRTGRSLDKAQGAVQKQLRKFGAATKSLVGRVKAAALTRKITSALDRIFRNNVTRLLAQKTARSNAFYGLIGGVSAAIGAIVAGTLGAAAPIAVAWAPVAAVLSIVWGVIDAMTNALVAILEQILPKIMDGEGICNRGQSLENLITDGIAYWFVENMLPLIGPFYGLFAPYTCYEPLDTGGGFKTVFPKDRVITPQYYFDRTLSLYYHPWADNEVPRGERKKWVDPSTLRPGFNCTAGICRGPCPTPGFKVVTETDLTCIARSDTKPPSELIRLPCPDGMRDDKTSCWEDIWCHTNCSGDWRPWTWHCDTNCGGCGCIRRALWQRSICPAGMERELLLCYPKCDPGMYMLGGTCWPESSRGGKLIEARDCFLQTQQLITDVAAFQPTLNLNQVTVRWCNFSSPTMLNRMAQFYYDQSYVNQQLLTDASGNFLVQYDYIVKFYGVIASSELSCDVACDIRTVRYNPITGGNWTEMIGNLYADNPYDKRAYRRFYFTCGPNDTQGLFTVTGCTNSDYTAPDAQVNSWDDGVEYVPSLPKVFIAEAQDRDRTLTITEITKAATAGAIALGTGIATTVISASAAVIPGGGMAAAGLAMGVGVAGGLLQIGAMQAIDAISGAIINATTVQPPPRILPNNPSKTMFTTDFFTDPNVIGTPAALTQAMKENLKAVAKDNRTIQDGFVSGDDTNGYLLLTRNEYFYINHGVVVEYAKGIFPTIDFCKGVIMPATQCINKWMLRNTIDRYHALNPTKHIKQVDLIEPRGTDGCYYEFREVSYNPATNVEQTDFTKQSMLQKYTIRNKATCVFVPDKGGLIRGSPPAGYEIRTTTIENGATAYPTRRVITKPVRYVRIEGGTDWINISQIVVYNTDFFNVSVGKPVRSSGVYPGSSESVIVDGTFTPRAFPNNYHSNGPNAWVEVDLESDQNILQVGVLNRADCCQDRLGSGYKINLLDSNRVLNYSFPLTARPEQFFTTFPALSMYRRYPNKSFEVPRPLPTETNLGGEKCFFRKCTDRAQIDRLVTDFNSANDKAKIMRVYRGATPANNRCDYEVDMVRIDGTNKLTQRETVTMTVAEGTRDCIFYRVSDGSAAMNSGTFIQANTPYLTEKDTSGGVTAVDSLMKFAKDTISAALSPITALNPLKVLKDNATTADQSATTAMTTIAANQGFAGCPQTSCKDPAILTAIMNRYNLENAGTTEQFGVERKTMQQIVKVAPGGGDTCDVVFQELRESYDDILYDPLEKVTATTMKRVVMKNTGNCAFTVADGPTAFLDISSTAVGILSPAANLTTPFTIPKCAVDCRAPSLLTALKAKLETTLNTTTKISNFKLVTQSFANGANTCEYKMMKDISERDPVTRTFLTDSDLETHVRATVTFSATGCVPTLATVEEFFSDDIVTETNLDSGEDETYINGRLVIPPILMSYDDAVPSKQVNTTSQPLK